MERSDEESWEVLNGNSILYTSPALEDDSLVSFEACLNSSIHDQYSITLIDSFGDAWSSGSFLLIEGLYGNRVLKTTMTDMFNETLPLSLYTPVMKGESWKFAFNSISDTWMDFSFDDDNWAVITLGAVPLPIPGTQYFRKHFVGLDAMAAYEVSFLYRHGIVAYINGVEVYRDHMPSGSPTGTTLSSASYSSTDYHAVIRPGFEVKESESILAVELHFPNLVDPNPLDFNAYLAVYASTISRDDYNCYSYAYDVIYSSLYGSDVDFMNDYDLISGYSIDFSELPATVSFSMSGPRAFFNGIRIWPHNDTLQAPSSFALQGRYASEEWTDIVEANDIVYEDFVFGHAMNFLSGGLYDNYQIRYIGSTAGNITVYEANPLICSLDSVLMEFDQDLYVVYANTVEVDIQPMDAFFECSISPSPSDGLVFNSTTCTLSGLPTIPSTTRYTIVSTVDGTFFSGSFTLQILSCTNTLVKFTRTYQSSAAFESFLIKDTNSTVILEVHENSTQIDDQNWSVFACLAPAKYTVTFSSSSPNWDHQSFLYIEAKLGEAYETILRLRYDSLLPLTVDFNAAYLIPASSVWTYRMGDIPENWYGSEAGGWSTGAAGTFVDSPNQIQLYKKTFAIHSLDDVSSIVLSLRYQYGVLVYLNGNEVFRKGVEGELSMSSMATTSFSECDFHQIALPVKTMGLGSTGSLNPVFLGTNTIAIALIASNVSQTPSSFDAAVRLSYASSRVWKSSQEHKNISGDVELFMDFGYSISSENPDNYYQVNFEKDRREWISSVLLSSDEERSNKPTDMVIMAKNPEDSEWTILRRVEGLIWYSGSQTNRIWLDNNKAYNQYRFENITNSANQWLLDRIDLRSDSLIDVIPDLAYNISSLSIPCGVDIIPLSPLAMEYTDFSVMPTLPTGISLDFYTGILSGQSAENATSTQVYTIHAKKITGESTFTSLTIATETCADTRYLTYAESPVVAIVDIPFSIIPDSTFNITRFFISNGTLPSGLLLDEETGEVYGLATEEESMHVVTICGEYAEGVASATLSISSRYGECQAMDGFPTTPVNETAVYLCSLEGLHGVLTRACTLGEFDGEWAEIQGECTNNTVEAPTSLEYAGNPFSLVINEEFSVSPNCTGCVSTTLYSVLFGVLPEGLSFDSTTGIISGTPTQLVTSISVTIRASNSEEAFIDTEVLFSVISLHPVISYSNSVQSVNSGQAILPMENQGECFECIYSVQASQSLPIGINLDANTGVISGIPTSHFSGEPIGIIATNGYGSANTMITLTVTAAPSSFSYDNPTRTIAVGSSFSMSPVIVASPCTFELVSGTLPNGITLNPTSGLLSGSPNSVTTEQTLVIKASNSAGSLQTTVKLTVQVTISSFSYPEASYSIYKNAVFSATPSVLGNPVTFSLQSGSLPSGLSLDPATGTLSGTPTEVSPESSLVVKAENGLGSLTTTVSLQVILALPTAFSYATGVEGWTGVSTDLYGSGSTPSIECEACTFAVESGDLVGFTLNAETGAISGTCTTEKENESTTVTIKAENTSGSTSASVSIACYGKPRSLVYPKSSYLIQKGKTFTTTPTTCSTYAWFNVTGTLPEGLVIDSATGQIQGTPSKMTFETVNIIKINPSGQVVFSMKFFVFDLVVTICVLLVILLLIVCIVLCCVKCNKKNKKRKLPVVRQKALPRPVRMQSRL